MDMDDTLLTKAKELTEENLNALREASEKGIEIVPTTGRFYKALPETLRNQDYIHYAVTINGAQVYDYVNDRSVCESSMKWEQVIDLLEYFDTKDVIYDTYIDNQGWMTEALQNKAEEFTEHPYYRWAIRNLRQPVPELKAFIRERKHDVQKVQVFVKDLEFRQYMMDHIGEMYPGIHATSAIFNNLEINSSETDKGKALKSLAEYLGYTMDNVMAIGDGINDISMIAMAGLGVAMENAEEKVKAAADFITLDCDHSGVAYAVRKFCL